MLTNLYFQGGGGTIRVYPYDQTSFGTNDNSSIGNALWHTDSSFNQHRSKYSLLLAHKIPKEGGNTNFADVRHAYRDLSEDKKAQLRGLVAKHE